MLISESAKLDDMLAKDGTAGYQEGSLEDKAWLAHCIIQNSNGFDNDDFQDIMTWLCVMQTNEAIETGDTGAEIANALGGIKGNKEINRDDLEACEDKFGDVFEECEDTITSALEDVGLNYDGADSIEDTTFNAVEANGTLELPEDPDEPDDGDNDNDNGYSK